MSRPKFNDARGAAVITGKPPFDFEGVSMRTFPLRAEIDEGTLEITLDEAEDGRASALFDGRFLVLEEGEWSSAWRARIELGLVEDEERGWQVLRTTRVNVAEIDDLD